MLNENYVNDYKEKLSNTEIIDSSERNKNDIEDFKSTNLDNIFKDQINEINNFVEHNKYLESKEKNTLTEIFSKQIENQFSDLDLKLSLINQQKITKKNKIQEGLFKNVNDTLKSNYNRISKNVENAEDFFLNYSNRITDEEYKKEILEPELLSLFEKTRNINKNNLDFAKSNGFDGIDFLRKNNNLYTVSINKNENLRSNDRSMKKIKTAIPGDSFLLLQPDKNKWINKKPGGKYLYAPVMDQNSSSIFLICMNDGDNVSQKKVIESEKNVSNDIAEENLEKNKNTSWATINSTENLRDPNTHKIIRIAEAGEKFNIINNLPNNGKYEYKLVEDSNGTRFKLCVNDGDNVNTSTNIHNSEKNKNTEKFFDFDRGLDDINSNLISETGELSTVTNNLAIHEVVNPKKSKSLWLKIPKSLSSKQALPKDIYLEAIRVGHTFVYKNFPQFGQVRIKKRNANINKKTFI